jgi:hypothetical protein
MYKSFVLKHVVEPPKLLFASFNATIISLAIWVCSSFIGVVLLIPVFYCFAITTALFLIIHGCMIFLSSKDPYFINVLIAKLRCRKTKNILQSKDNVYGA